MAMMPGSPRPSGPDHGGSRRWGTSPPRPVSLPLPGVTVSRDGADDSFDALLAEFTGRWDGGENPSAEDYLSGARGIRPPQAVELIYREFCLAEAAGLAPEPGDYLARFPEHAEALERVFGVDDVFGSSRLRLWYGPSDGEPDLPRVGDEIGPYRLLREVGRGGFARVFLAEQADLDDRLVVVKVSTRVTPEPQMLARASHPNIVEVIWHGLVDEGALQVLCMPFLGGASLGAVLAGRRQVGRRATTGHDLLADLDRAAAPEFAAPGLSSPSRELLATLSYPRAVAWVVARLAEALDFAYRRGVLHGDVKPSNVLLTAEGVPMLLDFNLAVGWRPTLGGRGADDLPRDPGGTLAYMAPERLQVLAGGEDAVRPTASERHRADVYALGVVLLEMLTGRPPELRGDGQGVTLQALASAYVTSRLQGAGVMIRAARAPVPAALRSILERCLATDPADRYFRAGQLSEDLDRWRNDRALVHAPDPTLRTGLACWARRQRRALIAAGLGVAVTAGVTVAVWRYAEGRRLQGLASGASLLHDGGDFLLRRAGNLSLIAARDPTVAAKRNLDRFGVLSTVDWRLRDEVRALSPEDRDELEAWLMEQALRYATGLGARPDSRADWERGLDCLERFAPAPPLAGQARKIRERLGLAERRDARRDGTTPSWRVEYLRGVEAELRGDNEDAFARYQNVLKLRPTSFWGNYRLAAVAFSRGRHDTAAEHLRRCTAMRPESPVLRHQLASCFTHLGQLDQAAIEYEKAQALDPDDAETYLDQGYLRLKLHQPEALLRDLARLDTLKGRLASPEPSPEPFNIWERPTVQEKPTDASPAPGLSFTGVPDPDELDVRIDQISVLHRQGQLEPALDAVNRVLAIDPENIRAHYFRGLILLALRSPDADQEFDKVVRHPHVTLLIQKFPTAVFAFQRLAQEQSNQGRLSEAVLTARRGLELATANREKLSRLVPNALAQSHYEVARACELAAREDATYYQEAVVQLRRARQLAPDYVEARLKDNPGLRKLPG